MDAETLKLAVQYGMNQSVCVICHRPTLFIVNKQKSNIPLTCGDMRCGKAAHESWAKDAPSQ